MDSESQSSLQPPLASEIPTVAQPPQPPESRLLAPIWHTILIVVIMLGNSYFTAKLLKVSGAKVAESRTLDYVFTIGFELFLLLLVWIGLRLKNYSLRELIGGKWNRPEDFLIDVGIAFVFWFVSALILLGLAYILGQMNEASLSEMKQRLSGLIPRSGMELTIWISLSVIAGLVEEILFRGYLQKQIGVIARNAYVGVIVSAVIFGAGHGYEGTKNMIRIAVFGALFGVLAVWRKSLRPGMMAHAAQDILAGGVAYFLAQKGKF